MSSRLRSSGGIATSTVERRKYRSERKRPASLSTLRSALVAATKRTSTGTCRFEPSGSTIRSWMTRRSLACSGNGMASISSRKTVPPSACSRRPTRFAAAPVKAPRSCPNISLSKMVSGTAAQLMATNGRCRRLLRSCRARAATSLPAPVSPRSSTSMSRSRNCVRRSRIAAAARDTPTKRCSMSPALSRSRSSSSFMRRVATARRSTATRWSAS